MNELIHIDIGILLNNLLHNISYNKKFKKPS